MKGRNSQRVYIYVSFLIIGMILSYALRATGATLEVGTDPTDEYQAIQSAIDAANAGDIILVDEGTYYENIDFQGKALRIKSKEGASRTIINGSNTDTVVTFCSHEERSSVLEGFTLTNGNGEYGGGIACYSSSPTILNCSIYFNTSRRKGGGIFCGMSSMLLVSSVIYGNSASEEGGGFACMWDSEPDIVNVTIVNNQAQKGGGVYSDNDSTPKIYNSIFWANNDEIYGVTGHTVFNSDIASGQFAGRNGNICVDPRFVNAGKNNYHVQPCSPCINKGKNEVPHLSEKDTEGQPRIINGKVDMGAYEYGYGDSDNDGKMDIQDNDDDNDGIDDSRDNCPFCFNSDQADIDKDTLGDACDPFNNLEPGTLEVGQRGYAYTSIQDAIDSALPGATILVHEGSYVENIDFKGKPVILKSVSGYIKTFIKARENAPVVSFRSGESEDSIIEGFTIMEGSSSIGGGVYCAASSPVIRNNRISANQGGGIGCDNHSLPLIENNSIIQNTSDQIYSLGSGGGILCYNNSDAHIVNNIIFDNSGSIIDKGQCGGI
ncbi:MAG: right-handed parallel beta-helix repeat-containing protein, partial [bacterium]